MGLENSYQWLEYIPLAFETAIAPLIYLYCLSLTEAKFRLTKKEGLHFVPFVLFMLYAIFFYLNALFADTIEATKLLETSFHLDPVKELEDYFTVVSIFIYLILGSNVLKKYRKQVNNYTSNNNHSVFGWLRNIQILMSVLIVFLVINMLVERVGLIQSNVNVHWKAYFLYIAVVIYYLGIKAVNSSPLIISEANKKQPKAEVDYYANDPKAEALAKNIEALIDGKKLYLNPTFSIIELSELLQVNQSTVSQVINRYIGCTFRDLINQKRIEMAKKQLLMNKDKGFSVLSQSLDCGFNSQASFYRVFKKHTGKSPSQYINTYKENNSDD